MDGGTQQRKGNAEVTCLGTTCRPHNFILATLNSSCASGCLLGIEPSALESAQLCKHCTRSGSMESKSFRSQRVRSMASGKPAQESAKWGLGRKW